MNGLVVDGRTPVITPYILSVAQAGQTDEHNVAFHRVHLLVRARTGHGSLSKILFGGEDFPRISEDRPVSAAFVVLSPARETGSIQQSMESRLPFMAVARGNRAVSTRAWQTRMVQATITTWHKDER